MPDRKDRASCGQEIVMKVKIRTRRPSSWRSGTARPESGLSSTQRRANFSWHPEY